MGTSSCQSSIFDSWSREDDGSGGDSDGGSSMSSSSRMQEFDSLVRASSDGSIARPVGLQLTPYDATVLSLTAIFDRRFREREGTRAIFMLMLSSAVIHVVNIIVQMILFFSLLATTVKNESLPYSDVAALNNALAALREAVETGVILSTLSDRTDAQDHAVHLCGLTKTLSGTHSVVIFLWFTRMMQEWMDAIRRFYYVMSLPWAKSHEPLIFTQNDKSLICKTTFVVQVIFVFFVSLPQFIVAFFLSWTGAKYLYFTTDMGTLAMKAISLSFIIQVDELMFLSFGSLRFKEQVKATGYLVNWGGTTNWNLWGMSVAKFSAALWLTYMVSEVIFKKVGELRDLCVQNTVNDELTLTAAWDDFLGNLPFQEKLY